MCDLLVGDFNTFPEDGGPEMIEALTGTFDDQHDSMSLVSCLPADTKWTFKAFEHDICKEDISKLEVIRSNPYNEIIEVTEDKVHVRFSSWLDHVFVSKYMMQRGVVVDCQVGPYTAASDHMPTITTIDFSRILQVE